MTLEQGYAFAVLAGTVSCLVWGKLRYDLVALCALLAALTCGIVPLDQAFRGFSDDIVIIVGSALVVSAGISRSGAVEAAIRPLAPHLKQLPLQVPVLVSVVTVMSALIKNIGALAILLPVSLQLAKQNGTASSRLLMPLSFGSLLGGLATLIGTSPNIIVSRLRGDLTGEPFQMFDFAPVGASLAVLGIAFLSIAWRLLPDRGPSAAANQAMFEVTDYTTEVRVAPKSAVINKTVKQLETLADGDVAVIAIIREHAHRYVPAGHWVLSADDLLVLEGEADALRKLIVAAGLEMATEDLADTANVSDAFGAFEAVVTDGSVMIGSSAQDLRLRDRYGVVLMALRRMGRRLRQRPRLIPFQAGDLVVLHGRADDMPETLANLGCLPLAERNLQLGRRRRIGPAVSILGIAVALIATGLVPVTIGFFGAAVVMLLTRTLTLKDAYQQVEWPVLILLGALIPVSGALQHTGATDLMAGWLSQAAAPLPPVGALALTLAVAMLVTPFLNNAATVLVMAPIAAGLAERLGLSVDPFLMAVAIGAGCDFLTPIGHQCNTLVMGPGGYTFVDYARLGAPLSVLVLIAAPLLISLVWPL